MGKDFGLVLDASQLTEDQLNSIKAMAKENYEEQARSNEDDIMKATICAVFSWIALMVHNETEH